MPFQTPLLKTLTVEVLMDKHLSDSTEQQQAEVYILRKLEEELGFSFDPTAILPLSTKVQPDAIDVDNKVVVEVYARVGAVKGAQFHKIKGDILKLALIEKELGAGWRKIMCFASDEAASYLLGNSWAAEAARAFGVEVRTVSLPEDHKASVIAAQMRQKMVNPT